ncbi:MAG: glycosyltransferase family 39 protein, partial [Elioraea sp.]|nr:glycosyltransferase family 39 protein [Elioraea sp.]
LAAVAVWAGDRLARRPSPWVGALRPAWGLPLALAVVLPWAVAIWLATDGAFFLEAIRGDLGQKVVGADEQHGGPPGYHLALAAVTLFPASLAVLRALPAVWAARREPATRVLLAWILPTWTVFELLPTKLPHYVSVTFPAVLLLAARWLLQPSATPPPRWLERASLALWLLVPVGLAALAVALPIVAGGVPWGLPFALAAAGWIVWRGLGAPDARRAVAAGLVGAAVLYAAILEGVIPFTPGIWLSPRIAEAAAAHWGAEGGRPPASERPFAAVGFHEPSLVFLLGTDVRLLRTGEEAARHLAERARGLALVRDRNEDAFRAEAERLGFQPRAVARVDGFNLSRGQFVSLGLYAR